jgi:hypothetical protein
MSLSGTDNSPWESRLGSATIQTKLVQCLVKLIVCAPDPHLIVWPWCALQGSGAIRTLNLPLSLDEFFQLLRFYLQSSVRHIYNQKIRLLANHQTKSLSSSLLCTNGRSSIYESFNCNIVFWWHNGRNRVPSLIVSPIPACSTIDITVLSTLI